jgi:hypothetical protein
MISHGASLTNGLLIWTYPGCKVCATIARLLPQDWSTPYRSSHTAPYAGTNVDESYFFGSMEQLRSYGKPEPAKPSASLNWDGGLNRQHEIHLRS